MTRPFFVASAIVMALACLAAGSVSAQPKTVAVTIEHFEFSPADIAVAAGDTIIFTNKDIVPHTATAADTSWTTDEIASGASAQITLPEKAGADYFCIFHPLMRGRLTLSPPE